MATNTSTKNGQEQSTAGKPKKATRNAAPTKKVPSAAPKKTAAKKNLSIVWQENLYDALPNPYHQPVPPYIWIDHPQQLETLHAADYVIRLGVGGEEQVEIDIDNSGWQPCRANSGYWWYDWSNIKPGSHALVARMKAINGTWYRTPERLCTYQA